MLIFLSMNKKNRNNIYNIINIENIIFKIKEDLRNIIYINQEQFNEEYLKLISVLTSLLQALD